MLSILTSGPAHPTSLLDGSFDSGDCCGPENGTVTDATLAYIQGTGFPTYNGSLDLSTLGTSDLHGECTAWCKAGGGQGCSRNVKKDTAPSFKHCSGGDYCALGKEINQCIQMPETKNPQVRVTKGFGPRGYNAVRVRCNSS